MKQYTILLLLCFLALPLAQASQVSYYTFNYTATDSWGSTDLTLSGNAAYSSDFPVYNFSKGDGGNGSIDLDGTNSRAAHTTANHITGTNNLTYAFWIKPHTSPSAGDTIYEQGNLGDTDRSIQIYFTGSGAIGMDYATGAAPKGTWEQQVNTNSTYPASLNEWSHIAIVFDNGYPAMYINGSLVGFTWSDQDPTLLVTDPNDDGVFIGVRADGNAWFDGDIDEFKVWDEPLNATQVATLYNCGVNESDCSQVPDNVSLVVLTAINAFTTASLNDFNISYFDVNDSESGTINTISYYNATFNRTRNNSIEVNFSKSGYVGESVNITLDDPIEYYTFSVYTINSLLVNMYDVETSLLITDNMSVTITQNVTEITQYTVTGSTLFESLNDGNYTVKIEGGNYTLASFTVTLSENSTQSLDAYLSTNTSTTIFTIRDFDSSAILEGASTTKERIVNGSWTVVESKLSDITGRVQFNYVPSVRYRFTVSLADYTTKQFELDPIIFEEYTIRLEKVVTIEEDLDYTTVTVDFSPKSFYNNASDTFEIIFGSPEGTFQSYGYEITYPGGSDADSGSNSIGETFTHPFTITGAAFLDIVNITYYYDTTIGDNRSYTYSYIVDGVVSNQSHLKIGDNEYGLGDFEKSLIATTVTIMVVGIGGLVAGSIAGLGLGLFVLGYFVYIGFYTIWAVIITMFIGFFILAKRSQ